MAWLFTSVPPRQFDISNLVVASYFLALGYFGLAILASFQLHKMNKFASRWASLKVFSFMLVLHVYVRALTWMTLCFMSLAKYDSDSSYPWQVVLFTTPEYLMMSTYTMLFFHWCEYYIFSHDQFVFLNRKRFSSVWKFCFASTSFLLYAFLITFYLLLFVEPSETSDTFTFVIEQRTEVFSNFGLPLVFTVAEIYLQFFLLSGFPFKSTASEARVTKVTRVFNLWTFGRIARGVMLLLSIQHQWAATLNESYYSMLTVTVLVVSEFLPIVVVLDWSVIQALLIGNESFEFPEEQTPLVNATSSQGGSLQQGAADKWTIALSHNQSVSDWLIDYSTLKLNPPLQDDGLTSTSTGKWRGRSIYVRGFQLQNIDLAMLQDLSQDLVNYSAIDDPFIVPFLGICRLTRDACVTLCQVTESMGRGSLRDLLQTMNSNLSAFNVIRIAREIAAALQHLHDIGCLHGHLTSKAIMLDGHMHIKVADVGLSRLIAYVEVIYSHRAHDPWTAPEVFYGHPRNRASDIYSLGVIYWELITRELPFKGEEAHLKKAVCSGTGLPLPPNSRLPAPLLQIVSSCLSTEPTQRPTIQQVVGMLSQLQMLDE